jgi:hypothetical protein
MRERTDYERLVLQAVRDHCPRPGMEFTTRDIVEELGYQSTAKAVGGALSRCQKGTERDGNVTTIIPGYVRSYLTPEHGRHWTTQPRLYEEFKESWCPCQS